MVYVKGKTLKIYKEKVIWKIRRDIISIDLYIQGTKSNTTRDPLRRIKCS